MKRSVEIARLTGQIAALEQTGRNRKSDSHPDGWLHQQERAQLDGYKSRLAQLQG